MCDYNYANDKNLGDSFLVEFNGKKVIGKLYDGLRIDRSTVPSGLNMYGFRHADDDWTEPISITPNLCLVNFMGSFITSQDLALTEETNIDNYSYM